LAVAPRAVLATSAQPFLLCFLIVLARWLGLAPGLFEEPPV
jgi:hypothetical protein